MYNNNNKKYRYARVGINYYYYVHASDAAGRIVRRFRCGYVHATKYRTIAVYMYTARPIYDNLSLLLSYCTHVKHVIVSFLRGFSVFPMTCTVGVYTGNTIIIVRAVRCVRTSSCFPYPQIPDVPAGDITRPVATARPPSVP